MRCLLDKVTARHIMEGMLKLVEGRTVTSAELFALYFYRRARPGGIELFILPQTENLLRRLEQFPRYAVLISPFLGNYESVPTGAIFQVSSEARSRSIGAVGETVARIRFSQRKMRKCSRWRRLERLRT